MGGRAMSLPGLCVSERVLSSARPGKLGPALRQLGSGIG